MVLNISISPEAEARLRTLARTEGLDVNTFAARELERWIARPSLEEVLAPLRAEVAASGLSDDELTELLEEAKHEARAERRAEREP
ncbi:MAG: hypothetical protein WD768_03470 [Phycisphaeraceae bacterium]